MQPLIPDTSYHIFNHANGFENVFREDENFRYFLEKYRLYITPVAETYAYCLMPNHFHLVIRIRKREVIEKQIQSKSTFSKVLNFGKGEFKFNDDEIAKYLSKQFANFFSCYTQSFNKRYKRMGSLFIKNFKREMIMDKTNFFNVIIYTHRNPVHHGFCSMYSDWGYSSYNEIRQQESEVVEVEKLLKSFGGLKNFEEIHYKHLEKWNQIVELETP
jgi:REP element-mobilizing transposase RayT